MVNLRETLKTYYNIVFMRNPFDNCTQQLSTKAN